MVYSSMLVYMAVTMITPGPNNLTMLFLGAEHGFGGTRKFLTASTVCLFIKTLMCGALDVGLAELIPVMVEYLKWVGAAYMLYLGYTMARSGWKSESAANSNNAGSTYRSGVVLQLLNMKSWLTCLGLYAAYVVPFTSSVITVIWVALLYTAFMLISSISWGLFGSAMRRFISRHRKPFGVIMGLSLLYCAVTTVM